MLFKGTSLFQTVLSTIKLATVYCVAKNIHLPEVNSNDSEVVLQLLSILNIHLQVTNLPTSSTPETQTTASVDSSGAIIIIILISTVVTSIMILLCVSVIITIFVIIRIH